MADTTQDTKNNEPPGPANGLAGALEANSDTGNEEPPRQLDEEAPQNRPDETEPVDVPDIPEAGELPEEPEIAPLPEAPMTESPEEPPEIEHEVETRNDNTPPSTLNERYDIYPGRPLPALDSPSARAFEAEDRMQPQLKLFALICIPGLPVRWEEMEDIKGKTLPGNLPLSDFGNVDWPILGQKCLAIIFERPLGGRVDRLIKSSNVPDYKKIDVLRLVAETGIQALTSLQENNLTHRSIRPDNMFFTDNDHEEILLGEFVSSPPGFDQPVVFETIERGMAPEGGRGTGTIEDDIYALGVTLAILLQRQNPVRGKSKEQILFGKITSNSYQALVGKTLLTASLLEPIRGMLHDNALERWGFEELEMWQGGRRVTPHQTDQQKKSQRPFHFGDFDHVLPRTLAFSMSERRESALKLIKDGALEVYFTRGLENAELAAAIAVAVGDAQALTETVPHADELLLSRVLMLMDPLAPITYKNISYMSDGFGTSLAVETLRGGDIKTYAESIVNKIPTIWFEVSQAPANTQYNELEFFAKISRFLKKAGPGFGIERCLYETNTGYACQSSYIIKENIYDIDMLLPTLNEIEKSADTKKSPVDRHIAAFIAARSPDNMDNHLSELGDLDRTIQTLGMLRLLVLLQNRMDAGTLLGLTKWVGGLMGPVIRLYHSRAKRREVEAEVPRIVRGGNLSELLSLLDDPVAKQQDEENYLAAVTEFGEAEEEVHNIENNTGPGSDAADRTSKQAASITSILIMIFIVSMIIIAG